MLWRVRHSLFCQLYPERVQLFCCRMRVHLSFPIKDGRAHIFQLGPPALYSLPSPDNETMGWMSHEAAVQLLIKMQRPGPGKPGRGVASEAFLPRKYLSDI